MELSDKTEAAGFYRSLNRFARRLRKGGTYMKGNLSRASRLFAVLLAASVTMAMSSACGSNKDPSSSAAPSGPAGPRYTGARKARPAARGSHRRSTAAGLSAWCKSTYPVHASRTASPPHATVCLSHRGGARGRGKSKNNEFYRLLLQFSMLKYYYIATSGPAAAENDEKGEA